MNSQTSKSQQTVGLRQDSHAFARAKRGLLNAILLAGSFVFVSLAVSQAGAESSSSTSSKQMFEDLVWEPGEAGEEVAKLWERADGASGMLIRASAGYSSGPVVRSSDYRAFVISGSVTNDRPGENSAGEMTKGTFWVQPGGAPHVTACKNDCIFYVEPDGPWDRVPAVDERNSPGGLEAKRIAPENLPWVDAPNTGGTVRLAHVWGDPSDPEPSGFFLFFKAGFPGFPHIHQQDYDGVVLQGRPKHWEPGETGVVAATPGSHLFQAGEAPHDDSCEAGEDCITYFRFHGNFDIRPVKAQ